MDKITRQVRIEHWTQIMNECLNSGMNKTEWCRCKLIIMHIAKLNGRFCGA